jgi:histidinol dehydrogenase
MSQQTMDDIALLAQAEGLDAHANSAAIRGQA